MARFVVNQHYHDGMFSSIQRGVREIGQQCDAFFLLPVDTPLVRTSTIMQLLETFESMPTTLICTPQYNDRNGHPPLIDTCLIDEILAYDGQGGLRSLLRNYQDKSCSVAVPDKHILMDLDTRNDLAHLRDAAW
jgi:CTP:molybdopterin cytidylyltransferase MocA